MRITLEFDGDTEASSASAALRAADWRSVALDMHNYLRDSIKYEVNGKDAVPGMILAKEKLHEILSDLRLDLFADDVF